ncbi:hypothetical protein P170DRAFT_238242 [Aspergillus steynii IBT 23096]|uniref:Uncharacterized protein n=1 Tax=Aspergillus steynii IBT 23096 TaxID=1392250 RepID=A0A2I2G340_9EURO|nr:uncharacterized protein P170DRAFT_238242 [Aspergillus steynii IBT 23096]PLB47296.1 hypothetical protein P170DRAFT_238242 [Aspergillus steynii IBT 23096]
MREAARMRMQARESADTVKDGREQRKEKEMDRIAREERDEKSSRRKEEGEPGIVKVSQRGEG